MGAGHRTFARAFLIIGNPPWVTNSALGVLDAGISKALLQSLSLEALLRAEGRLPPPKALGSQQHTLAF
jgi:hypothetical protein